MLSFALAFSRPLSTGSTEANAESLPTRLRKAPIDTRILAGRTEQAASRKLLDTLKAFFVRLKAHARAWVNKRLDRSVSQARRSAVIELRQRATRAPSLKKHLSQIQSAGCKTAQDSVSYLRTSPLIQQLDQRVSLRAAQIDELRGAILDHSVNFTQIKQAVKTCGDLQLVHQLARHKSASQPTINEARNSLETDHPDLGSVLGGLMDFAQNEETGWDERCKEGAGSTDKTSTPEDRFDAAKQQSFLTEQLQRHIKNLDQEKGQRILEQLEGPFGLRMRGVIDTAVEVLSRQAASPRSKEGQLLSRFNRVSALVVNLINEVHDELKIPLSEAVQYAPTIEEHLFTPQELAVLIDIGVNPNHLALVSPAG